MLQAFASEHRIPDALLKAADLALEEHLTNVINYAYEDSKLHEILVRLELKPDAFQIVVEDDGKAFNPVEQPEPDTSLPLIDRPIGGLGILLIRRSMDELSYRRDGNRNVFQMRKRLPPSPPQLS